MTIEGVNIDDATDFARLADDALRSRIGDAASTSDGPLGWLSRAWPKLRGSSVADRLAHAIAQHVVASDTATKHAALLFLVTFPDAGLNSMPILERAAANRSAYRGVLPPDGGSADLEWWLWRAIASVASTGAQQALRLIEAEALRPDGKAEPIMHTLVTQDGPWFKERRDEVIRTHPSLRELVETIEAGA